MPAHDEQMSPRAVGGPLDAEAPPEASDRPAVSCWGMLPTPFDQDGSLDPGSLAQVAGHFADAGCAVSYTHLTLPTNREV